MGRSRDRLMLWKKRPGKESNKWTSQSCKRKRTSGNSCRLARNYKDASEGCTSTLTDCSSVMLEKEFADNIITHRARPFCSIAVTNMKLECSVQNLTTTGSGILFLQINAVLRYLMDWLFDCISLENLSKDPITLADMYQHASILLFSHTTGFSYKMAISLLTQAGSTAFSLERVTLVSTNILAYSTTGWGTTGFENWNAHRDETRMFTEFETLCF